MNSRPNSDRLSARAAPFHGVTPCPGNGGAGIGAGRRRARHWSGRTPGANFGSRTMILVPASGAVSTINP